MVVCFFGLGIPAQVDQMIDKSQIAADAYSTSLSSLNIPRNRRETITNVRENLQTHSSAISAQL